MYKEEGNMFDMDEVKEIDGKKIEEVENNKEDNIIKEEDIIKAGININNIPQQAILPSED